MKLGALGNVVLSFGPFEAIRRHHAGAHITLLTTTPYADWLARAPWFDDVWIDERPEWWDLPGLLRLRRRLTEGTVRPRLRSPDLRPIQPLLPASAVRQPPRVVGHRSWLRPARPRSEPQPAARFGPPVRPTPSGWHQTASAGRSVLEQRRYQPLRPARALRIARPRQLAAPAGQALARDTVRRTRGNVGRARPDASGRRYRPGADTRRDHPARPYPRRST